MSYRKRSQRSYPYRGFHIWIEGTTDPNRFRFTAKKRDVELVEASPLGLLTERKALKEGKREVDRFWKEEEKLWGKEKAIPKMVC